MRDLINLYENASSPVRLVFMNSNQFREYVDSTAKTNSKLKPGSKDFTTDYIKYVYPLDKNIHLVLLDGKKIAAVAGVETNPYYNKQLWIKYVSVAPEYRGKQYGKMLLDNIYKFAGERGQKVKNGGFTDDGEKYLKHLHADLEKKYPHAAFSKNSQGKYVDDEGRMLEDQQPLTELFSTPAPVSWVQDMSGLKVAEFTAGLETYRVYLYGNEQKASVQFEHVDHGQTVTGTGNTQIVFSTVLKLIMDFINEKNPAVFYFSASLSTPSRVKLYNRLAERLAALMTDYVYETSDDAEDVKYEFRKKELMTEAQTESGVLTFERLKNIEPDNRGFRVDKVNAYLDGKLAGYLKISYIPRSAWDRRYKTIFNFMAHLGGIHYLPFGKESSGLQALTNGELYKILEQIYNERAWGSAQALDPKMSRKDLLLLLKKEELELMKGKQGEKYMKAFRFHVDKPIVDSIRVFDEHDGDRSQNFRRKGIGRKLYAEAAKWLQERGLKLHASGCQTDDARACWAKFEKEGGVGQDDDGRRYIDFI